MTYIQKWKEPLYKDDVTNVLLMGFLAALLGGILGGLVDYLLSIYGVGLSATFIIMIFLIGPKMRKAYYNHHILYPTLSIFFLILGFFISYYVFRCALYITVFHDYRIYRVLANGSFWIGFLLSPFDTLITGVATVNFLYISLGIINFGIDVWAFFYTYRLVDGQGR